VAGGATFFEPAQTVSAAEEIIAAVQQVVSAVETTCVAIDWLVPVCARVIAMAA